MVRNTSSLLVLLSTIFFLAAFFTATPALAQNLAPGPQEWQAFDPAKGVVEVPSPYDHLSRSAGAEALLAVRGHGENSVYWRTKDLPLEPGGTYAFHFNARGQGSGLIISGPDSVNHDFQAAGDWRPLSHAFRLPDEKRPCFLRLGQWELSGEVAFDQPELYPVRVVHLTLGAPLSSAKTPQFGKGEILEAGRYTDTHQLGWEGTTIHRTLYQQRAAFNTHRWCFSEGSEVIYKHDAPCDIKSAALQINVNYHTGGKLQVSASRDGTKWLPAFDVEKVGEVSKSLPAELFRAREVLVRLRGEGAGANLQVDAYSFRSEVDYFGPRIVGKTWLIEERAGPAAGGCPADTDIVWEPSSGLNALRLARESGSQREISTVLDIDGRKFKNDVKVPAGTKPGLLEVMAPMVRAGPHTIEMKVTEQGALKYHGRMDLTLGTLDERGYCQKLPSSSQPGLDLWWCDGARKVSRDWPAGGGEASEAIIIEAARGEFEPAQLVLRSALPGLRIDEAAVTDLKHGAKTIPASSVCLFEVATVRVESPSDSAGGPGDYPDPLPPLKTPLELPEGQSQAIWILARVPEDAAAGRYDGALDLSLSTSDGRSKSRVDVRLRLEVFDFTLPRQTRLRGGFGLDLGLIKRYHGLETDEQLRTVYDLYLRSFAEHRIMPYTFFAMDPMGLRWEGEGEARKPIVDFSAFDKAAARYLDDPAFGFNSLDLPIQGLGGGTFHERHPGEFGGFKVGTPEYERLMGDYLGQIERHLREKGWLSKAYVYWFDEPEPRDYPFVIDVMQRLKKHAPGIRRMLTEQPEKDLLGNVDIWCGLTPEWTPDRVAERRKAGEEVWWYICTGPKAPWIGLFIEHPALEMRLWPWQTWQYGVQGILVWQTNYWTSGTAFPGSLQDPWKDPMSYTSGYGVPSGTKLHWGNGDGRFFYPPRRDPLAKGPPVLEPPISSIRWENLRDGVEDHDYFVLLSEQVERLRGKADAALIREAEGLLVVPEAISKDVTHFTTDPGLVLEHRRKVARMIEKLQEKERR